MRGLVGTVPTVNSENDAATMSTDAPANPPIHTVCCGDIACRNNAVAIMTPMETTADVTSILYILADKKRGREC